MDMNMNQYNHNILFQTFNYKQYIDKEQRTNVTPQSDNLVSDFEDNTFERVLLDYHKMGFHSMPKTSQTDSVYENLI